MKSERMTIEDTKTEGGGVIANCTDTRREEAEYSGRSAPAN